MVATTDIDYGRISLVGVTLRRKLEPGVPELLVEDRLHPGLRREVRVPGVIFRLPDYDTGVAG